MESSSLPTYVVFFADIVGYSKLRPNERQKRVVEQLQQVAEKTYPVSVLKDRPRDGVFIPTGDGMVIAFRSASVATAPQSLIILARELQDRLNQDCQCHLRIGLHAGTAQPYTDFNAKHFFKDVQAENNLAGASVNLTQRVMSLGDPGDILVTEQFRTHYQEQRGSDGAGIQFHLLGDMQVKHGQELKVYRCGSSAKLPKRIRNYVDAQNVVMRSIEQIIKEVEAVADKSKRSRLRTRASLLPLDRDQEKLFVSNYRVGESITRYSPQSPARFTLTEGPGRVLKDGQVRYYVMPDPNINEEAYFRAFAKTPEPGIPRAVVEMFIRRSLAYLYFPVNYGLRDDERFGVLSIDSMCHFVERNRKNQFKRDVTTRVQPHLRQIGIAWTIIDQN